MKKHCYIIILAIFFSQSLVAQGDVWKPNKSNPDKCYAKCLITSSEEIEEHEEAYPIYIGDQPESVELETITITLNEGEARSKWVKKRADKNCLSADPNDCMVWCLVEERPEPMVLEIEILADTTQTDEFVYEYFLIENSVSALEQSTEWREVVCNRNITSSLISELQEKLSEEGYYHGNPIEKFTTELELALFKFQKDHSLPYGQIDMESLSELGIYP